MEEEFMYAYSWRVNRIKFSSYWKTFLDFSFSRSSRSIYSPISSDRFRLLISEKERKKKAKRTNFSTSCEQFNRDKSFYTTWRKFRELFT